MSNSVLLSTAYLPNLNYLKHVVTGNTVFIERHEHFIKQTYRNRCELLTSNGKITLSIPLIKQSDKELIGEKKISYTENWQHQHWQTITSAYKNSPYFEYFEDELIYFYKNKFDSLFDYNYQLLNCILKILRIQKEIEFTQQFNLQTEGVIDLRNITLLKNTANFSTKPYYQVFASTQQFNQNLSCLDAIFNIGLKTLDLF